VFEESGYLDTTPLQELLTRIINSFGNVARRTIITTANDVLNGNQLQFIIKPGQDDKQPADWRAAVVKGSASMPFVFPPTSLDKYG